MSSHIKESLEGSLMISLEINKKSLITLSSSRASIDVHLL
jgi:hypothetical protein